MEGIVKRPRHDWEYWYTLLGLAFLTNALVPILYDLGGTHVDSYTDSNPLKLILASSIYLMSGLLLFREPGRALRSLQQNLFVLPLLLLPLLSTLWSVDPGTTSRRAIAFTLTSVFCIYLAGRLSPEELLKRLMFVLLLGGVASILYAELVPLYGIHNDWLNGGAWKGVYGHKNELGRISAIALIVAYYVRPTNRAERLYRLLTLTIFLFLLLMSHSRTNWLIMIGSVGLIPLLAILHSKRLASSMRVPIILLLGLGFVLLIAAGADVLLSAIDRTWTFSGRETLWRGVIAIVTEHYPVLGAGYGAFFNELGGMRWLEPYLIYWIDRPNHAHNGYLNVLADLGSVGLLALVTFIVLTSAQLVRRVIREPDRYAWRGFSGLMFVYLVNNVSESVALKHSDIAWALVLLASFYISARQTAHQPLKSMAQSVRGASVPFKPMLKETRTSATAES